MFCLKWDPAKDKKFLFKWRVSEVPLVRVCSRRQKVIRGRSGQKMKDKKTLWFSSRAASMSKNIHRADKSYNAPERGGEPRPGCPERFQRFPLRRQQPGRQLCVCSSKRGSGCMWCDCSATSQRLQPVLGWEPSMALWRTLRLTELCRQQSKHSFCRFLYLESHWSQRKV